MLRASEKFQNLLGRFTVGWDAVVPQEHLFGNLADTTFDLETYLVVEILLTLFLSKLWVIVTGSPALGFPDFSEHRRDELFPLTFLSAKETLVDHLPSVVVEKVVLAM